MTNNIFGKTNSKRQLYKNLNCDLKVKVIQITPNNSCREIIGLYFL